MTAPPPPEPWQACLQTTDDDRLAYLYSILDDNEAVDDDFASAWTAAVERCAADKGWLVLRPADVAAALAHPVYGAPPGLDRALRARYAPAASLTHAAEKARRWAAARTAGDAPRGTWTPRRLQDSRGFWGGSQRRRGGATWIFRRD